jgi:hypothetical protein
LQQQSSNPSRPKKFQKNGTPLNNTILYIDLSVCF